MKFPAECPIRGIVETLCDLFRVLGNSLDLEETFFTLHGELHRVLAYEAISVHLLEAGRLAPAYDAGADARSLMAVGEPAFGIAAEQRTPSLNLRLEVQGRQFVALAVPLEHIGKVSAILGVYRDGSQPFSGEDLDLIQVLAPKLAAAIENARTYLRVEELAVIDSHTGLLNGRALFQRLDAEVARARRGHCLLAVLHCSLEGCEASIYGRENSTRAQERVGAAILEDCREYDFCARSGDDLVLVLAGFRGADLRHGRVRFERIVKHIGLETGLPLSVRIGAAFFPEDGSDAEGLLAVAAQRLPPAGRQGGLWGNP